MGWLNRTGGSLALAIGLALVAGPAAAAEVKVALIAPFSGPYARQGELMKMGAELAVEHINKAGGVKALGGATLKLITTDTGDTVEKAKNAAQRLVAQEPDVVGGTGSYLSAFTLAVTEVTERAELPWLTLSYSDAITGRGFKYVFQTSPTAGWQSVEAMPTVIKVAEGATGRTPKTAGIVMDSTPLPVSFTKPMREGGLEKLGMKLVVDETFTPPLSDATPLIQKLRGTRPDLLLLLPSSVPDTQLLLNKMSELGLGRGRVPVILNGGQAGAPELVKLLGKEALEGAMVIVANWTTKGQDALAAEFRQRTGEPWMTQDSLCPYGDMWILKEAMERAGSADRRKVGAAMHEMDLTDGPARFYPNGRIKFDAAGRIVDPKLVILQWQDGVPLTVFPPEAAVTKAIWPKS